MQSDSGKDIINEIKNNAGKLNKILFLGNSDSGKTTFIWKLAEKITHFSQAAVIDSDIGQSRLGPPTTVGWQNLNSRKIKDNDLFPSGISFTGDIKPQRHLLQLSTSIVISLNNIPEDKKVILIDTPGFFDGDVAKALWLNIIRLISPTMVVIFQKGQSEITDSIRKYSLEVIEISTSEKVKPKTPCQRKKYRRDLFKKYFKGSKQIDIDLRSVPLSSTYSYKYLDLKNRVVALRDKCQEDKAIALIKYWDWKKKNLKILTPFQNMQEISYMIMGDINLEWN